MLSKTDLFSSISAVFQKKHEKLPLWHMSWHYNAELWVIIISVLGKNNKRDLMAKAYHLSESVILNYTS